MIKIPPKTALCNPRGDTYIIAELGYGNFDYSMLDDHSVYITYLQVVEKEMFRLLAKFPDTDPNNDYNRLKIVFNRLCNIGYT